MSKIIMQNICQMTQKQLKLYCAKMLRKTHDIVEYEDGFIFAYGTFPVLLVAHLDTVHKTLPTKFNFDNKTQALSSPNGLGADDRCGVYMIFEILKKFNCSVLFCEDEEIGCVGASKFVKSEISKNLKFNYIIELDRMGSNDAVFYDCDNPEFEEFICKDFYKTRYGTFSDISVVAPYLEVAAVNLSCGYYNAHTNKEYCVLPEMYASIEEVCKILDRTTDSDKFEYIEYKYNKYSKTNSSVDYYDCYDEMYWIVEYVDANGDTQWDYSIGIDEDSAVGYFMKLHQDIPYYSIICIEQDVC